MVFSNLVSAVLFGGVVLVSLQASCQDLRIRTISNLSSVAIVILGVCHRLYLSLSTLASAPGLASAAGLASTPGLTLWMSPMLWMQVFNSLVFSATILCVASVAEWCWRARTGRVGFGMGDIKFVAAWSVLLERYVFVGLLLASFAAATYGYVTRQKTFAFVPWLSCSFVGILCLVSGL